MNYNKGCRGLYLLLSVVVTQVLEAALDLLGITKRYSLEFLQIKKGDPVLQRTVLKLII